MTIIMIHTLLVFIKAEKAKEALIERIREDFANCDGETDSYSEDEDSDDIVSSSGEESSDSDEQPKKMIDKNAKNIINDLHQQFPNALSAPKKFKHEEEKIPGFDKKNWDHIKPLIIKELDHYKSGYWEYENKYSYLNYKICKQAVNIQ